jgi:membrane protease YdiL (CAAX protease family)
MNPRLRTPSLVARNTTLSSCWDHPLHANCPLHLLPDHKRPRPRLHASAAALSAIRITHSGHYLTAKPLHSILGFGISALSIAYACLNPFTEELIVRGYTISEVLDLGANRTLAVLISVLVQLSYHLYQGFVNVLWLMPMFVVFSIYYVRSRRILPIIIVHLAMDLLAILRGQA